jgi:uncharacterized protein YacL (UPF0231 family)
MICSILYHTPRVCGLELIQGKGSSLFQNNVCIRFNTLRFRADTILNANENFYDHELVTRYPLTRYSQHDA